MAKKRYFTEAELKAMGTRTRDLLDKAIDEGDAEKAKKLCHRMYAEWLAMHDLYVRWVASLLSYVYDNYGDESLQKALKKSCAAWYKVSYENIAKADDFKRKVEMFAMGLRGHLQPIIIEEDDEKVSLKMDPCGSGGRLLLSGAYEPPLCLSKVKKGQEITLGQADFPIYCCHTPMIEMLQIEWGGELNTVCKVPDDIKDLGCSFLMYKDPNKVPEQYYKRLSKERKKRS